MEMCAQWVKCHSEMLYIYGLMQKRRNSTGVMSLLHEAINIMYVIQKSTSNVSPFQDPIQSYLPILFTPSHCFFIV